MIHILDLAAVLFQETVASPKAEIIIIGFQKGLEEKRREKKPMSYSQN
jgi:hypothetical protein